MTDTRKQIAIFPDQPRDKQIADEKGNLTAHWELYFNQMTLALQTNYKPEGIVIPPKTAAEIGELGNVQGAIANILYDNTNNVFKGIVLVSNIGGNIITQTKTFTIT